MALDCANKANRKQSGAAAGALSPSTAPNTDKDSEDTVQVGTMSPLLGVTFYLEYNSMHKETSLTSLTK